MTLADLLPYGVIVLTFAQFFTTKKDDRTRLKLGLAVATLVFSGLIVYASNARAKDQQLRHEADEDALAKQVIATKAALEAAEGARKEATDANAEATATKAVAKDTAINCYQSRLGNETMLAWMHGLRPWQLEALKAVGCGPPPPWINGGGQIRIITSLSEREARMRRALLMTMLSNTEGQNWSIHVTPPVESVPTDAAQRDHEVYVVALNQIEESVADAACTWLACKGIQPGTEPCAVRDARSALGKLGVLPTERDPHPASGGDQP